MNGTSAPPLRLHSPREILYHLWREKKEIIFLTAPIIGLAIFLQVFTAKFTTALPYTSKGIPDAILSHIPPQEWLRPYFVWGYMTFIGFAFVLAFLFDVERVPRLIYLFAAIVITRTIFICFTHLGMPEGAVPVTFPGPTQQMKAENDLFFSGHTAIPFMIALAYRDRKAIFWLYIAASLSLGFTSLCMHRHYSIDVLAAPFIAFGIYTAANRFYLWMRPRLFKRPAAG